VEVLPGTCTRYLYSGYIIHNWYKYWSKYYWGTMMIGVRPFLRCCYGHYPKHRKYIAINHGITEDLLIDSKSEEAQRCHSSSTATATSATINLIRQQTRQQSTTAASSRNQRKQQNSNISPKKNKMMMDIITSSPISTCRERQRNNESRQVRSAIFLQERNNRIE
jgi:hypothetical protein